MRLPSSPALIFLLVSGFLTGCAAYSDADWPKLAGPDPAAELDRVSASADPVPRPLRPSLLPSPIIIDERLEPGNTERLESDWAELKGRLATQRETYLAAKQVITTESDFQRILSAHLELSRLSQLSDQIDDLRWRAGPADILSGLAGELEAAAASLEEYLAVERSQLIPLIPG